MQNFPEIDSNSFVVLQCDSNTGTVLTKEGEWYRNDTDHEVYFIFSSLETAKKFANQCIEEKPLIETIIYNHKKDVVQVYKNDAYIETHTEKLRQERKQEKNWWKFW